MWNCYLSVPYNYKVTKLRLHIATYVPEMRCTRVSSTRLAQNDVPTLMKPSGCVLATTKGSNRENSLILPRDNLYYLKAESDTRN